MEKRFPNVILATACLPWTDQYELDEALFIAEVQGLISRGIQYIYLFGTAGEGYAVSDKQFHQITGLFARMMHEQNCFPIIGLISLSFMTMLERIQEAYFMGIRDFMFALPSWGALEDDELSIFLHRLCDPYPDCRFIHYNNPRSKRVLTCAEYEFFADKIPNLVGVKYSTSDKDIISDLAKSCLPLRFFLTENGFAEGSLTGDFGLLLSIASTNIAKARQYYRAGIQKDVRVLRSMQKELKIMVATLADVVGSRIDGGYDKIFSKIRTPSFPLRLLPPYLGATEEAFKAYVYFLRTEMPHWIE